MLVVELATLFAPTVSFSRFPAASRNCTDAVFVIAEFPATTVTRTMACAPAASAPILQVNRLAAFVQTPWVAFDETKAPGSVSARVTNAASPGPLLVIAIVKVTNEPALTEAGEVMLMDRSTA